MGMSAVGAGLSIAGSLADSGGGGVDEIDLDTSIVDDYKNEALTFLAESLSEGMGYAEEFLNKSFNQRMAFHDQAMADFDRMFALSEPYRKQGFAAFDKLNDMFGLARPEGGSYEMSKALENEAKQRGLRQRLTRANTQFVNELGVKDPVLSKNLNYMAQSGMNPTGLMNAISNMRGYDLVNRKQPFENLGREGSEGGEAPQDWKTAGLTSQQWPGAHQEGLRNSTYSPYSRYMEQAAPIAGQLQQLVNQQSPYRRRLVQSAQTGTTPVRRL